MEGYESSGSHRAVTVGARGPWPGSSDSSDMKH